ncbi:unnamed protein product, partial [Candidula unifasciata]
MLESLSRPRGKILGKPKSEVFLKAFPCPGVKILGKLVFSPNKDFGKTFPKLRVNLEVFPLDPICNCSNGRPCAPDGSCCHELCLGGCSGTTAADCYVCTHVVYNNECLSHCPSHTFMLFNRRCLTRNECLNLRSRSGRINRSDSSVNIPKLLMGNSTFPSQCVFKCPPGYMVKEKDLSVPECIRCQGICPKVCNTTKVSSVQNSEVLFGCSKINGSLEIQITGGRDVDYELTKNLGAIREVTGYIRIWRTYSLLTLHFFRDLEIIGGEKLVHKEYSLFIADNTNLQELFPEHQMKKMLIQKGKVGFHSNRKLCLDKIYNFVHQLNYTSQLDNQRINISNSSNGNLIPCKSMTLQLVLSYTNSALLVHWSSYQSSDSRNLIHYAINYKEPIRDIFQGRDACVFFEMDAVYPLKPFTKYAIYVQAVTLQDATVSAMTNITYFVTSTYKPTEPLDLEVFSPDPHELTVRWKPPKAPNGNVTHYKVFYQPQTSSTNGFEQRDFCKDPMVITKDVQKQPEVKIENAKIKTETALQSEHGPQCCSCQMSEEEKQKKEALLQKDIIFEDDLHSVIYTKQWTKDCAIGLTFTSIIQPKTTRRRRNLTNNSSSGLNFNDPIIFHYKKEPDKNNFPLANKDGNVTNSSMIEPEPSLPNLRQEVIVYDTVVTLSNLEHFLSYNIEVVACHETNPVTGVKLCGESAIVTGQTAADPLANSLNSSLVVIEPVVNKTGAVLVRWEPPPMPNGLILKYFIACKSVTTGRRVTFCVTARQFQNNSNGYLLMGLAPGNYSLQISAHSLAGNGTSTPELFFSVLFHPGREEDSSISTIIGISAGLVISFLTVFGVIIYYVYKQRYIKADVVVSQNPHYIPTEQLYAPDEWEVPRDSIRLIKEMGQGSFGTVFEGLMEDPETKVSVPVAIK